MNVRMRVPMQRDRATAIVIVLVFASALIASTVWAAVMFTPPDEKQVQISMIDLIPQRGSRASGIAALISNIPNTRFALAMELKGLNPRRAHTAWFAGHTAPSIPQTQGIGSAPYALQVDSKGNARLSTSLNYNPRTRWKRIEIIEHPDRNPRNLKNVRRILVGNTGQLR